MGAHSWCNCVAGGGGSGGGSGWCQMLVLRLFVVTVGMVATAAADSASETTPLLPNVLLFIVDDLGWNQVGYHAKATGNLEIQTPHIDAAAAAGIELNRGYVTPWYVYVRVCGVFTWKESLGKNCTLV
jgi:hypothetical protein